MESTLPLSRQPLRRALLACGILASLWYAVINVIVPGQWSGYDPASQTISELSAVGAPSRTLWNILCAPYSVLMLAFAIGVQKSATDNRRLRRAANLLLCYSLLGLFWPFVPMHLRTTLAAGGATISDTLHIAFGAITEIIYLIALGLAAFSLGRVFRWYCLATFATLLVFGLLTFIAAPGVGANQPTPLIGVWERINIGVFLLWVIVLAFRLMVTKRSPRHEPGHRP